MQIKLDLIQTLSPCSVGWDSMSGNNRERFCRECNYIVHNLSEMNRKDAEALIANATGRLCAKYVRRADGSIVTTDLTPSRRRMGGAGLRLTTGAFGVLLALGSNAMAQSAQ